jgi:hypothetical protein
MATTYASHGGREKDHNPLVFMEYLERCPGDPNLKQRVLGRLQNLEHTRSERALPRSSPSLRRSLPTLVTPPGHTTSGSTTFGCLNCKLEGLASPSYGLCRLREDLVESRHQPR